MASKITTEDILNINKEYYDCHNYSEVARRLGWSASTVRKYVDKSWTPADETTRKIFNPSDLNDSFDTSIFKGVENFGELCVLSEEEIEEIKELWKELDI